MRPDSASLTSDGGLAAIAGFLKIIHLLAIAIGAGTTVTITFTMFRRVEIPITREAVQILQAANSIVLGSLFAALITGVALALAGSSGGVKCGSGRRGARGRPRIGSAGG